MGTSWKSKYPKNLDWKLHSLLLASNSLCYYFLKKKYFSHKKTKLVIEFVKSKKCGICTDHFSKKLFWAIEDSLKKQYSILVYPPLKFVFPRTSHCVPQQKMCTIITSPTIKHIMKKTLRRRRTRKGTYQKLWSTTTFVHSECQFKCYFLL